MKLRHKSLAAALCAVLLLAPGAHAQLGAIALSSESAFLDTELASDDGLVYVYVFHMFGPEATGSRFRVRNCYSTMALIGTFPQNGAIVLGTADNGVECAYGMCAATPFHFLTLAYAGSGDSPANSSLTFAPHPNALTGDLEAYDCQNVLHTVEGICLCIKCTVPFGCGVLAYDPPPCPPVPVEETTWGRVKVLYQ